MSIQHPKEKSMNLPIELFYKIIYALGIGILMGLERSIVTPMMPNSESCKKEKNGDQSSATTANLPDTFLGVRTYAILSLGGFSAALIGEKYPAAATVIIAGLVACIIAMYWWSCHEDPGITTEIAAVMCCCLGMLCYIHPHAAGVLALMTTVILAMKPFVAKTLKQLKRVELTDTLKLLIIIMIILPLLPDRDLDPYGAFNPYQLTFLIILICGISFVGYFLTKFLGPAKGLGLTGILGGLTSSTAVTAAMAVEAKESPGLTHACIFATVIANATMFGRVLVVVAILDRSLLGSLVWSIGAMMAIAFCAAAYLWSFSRTIQATESDASPIGISLQNPFSLGPAIKFSVFFVIILFVAKIAKIYFGDTGIYLASLFSGLADVDAITLSIIQQTKATQLAHEVGATGITIAVVANSLVKSAIAVYSGGWHFGRRVGMILIGSTIAGLFVSLFL
jgi:uncharacterized membrane protein (DUF4010 family)